MRKTSLNLFRKKEVKGFTLIDLLIVILVLGILVIISVPTLLKQVNQARTAEAKNNLGLINRSQHAYYFQKSAFADSLTMLNIKLTVGSFQGGSYKTDFYSYSVDQPPTATEVHHLATPTVKYINDTNAVTSAIFIVDDEFNTLLCEANEISVTPNIVNLTTCNNGTFIK